MNVIQYISQRAKCLPSCQKTTVRRTAQGNNDVFPFEVETVDDLFKAVSTLLKAFKPKELADTRPKVINITASIFDPTGFSEGKYFFTP